MDEEGKQVDETEIMPEAPTQAYGGPEGGKHDDDKPKAGWLATHRRMAAGIGAGVAAVAIVAGLALSQGTGTTSPAQSDAPVEQAADTSQQDEAVSVPVSIQADGWTDDSTPAIAHIASSDGSVDYFHAVSASEAASGATVDLTPGDYTVSWVSPINADGSIYTTGDPQQLTVGAAQSAGATQQATGSGADVGNDSTGGDAAPSDAVAETSDSPSPTAPTVQATMTQVPADQVTTEQMQAVLDQVGEAVSKGDATLSGAAGQDVVTRAATNAQAAPNADHDQVNQSVTDAASKVEAQPTQEAPKTEQAQEAKPTSSDNGSTSSSTSTPAQPTKQRTWVAEQGHSEPVYGQVWVQDKAAWDETVVDRAAWDETVTDKAAYDEPVYTTKYVYVCTDGYVANSAEDADDHSATADGFVSYHTEERKVQTGTKHHDAVTHVVHHDATTHVVHHDATGHYEQRQTGTRWVVDVAGHWE